MENLYQSLVDFLIATIGAWGYLGIFVLMFLESSFFPFPSEIIMIPAGYLAFKGSLDLGLIILAGVLGSIGGAWLNYFIADKFGRRILLKFVKEHRLNSVEKFFRRHGHISTFNGRLIPLVRQYISFPAGLAKMAPVKFTVYTALGAGIWVGFLSLLGYFIGQNEQLIGEYLNIFTIAALGFVAVSTAVYFYFRKN